jgi:hypothetical protein
MSGPNPSLPDVLGALAEMLGDVERRDGSNGAEYRRRDRAFAVVTPRGVEVRLNAPIAAAARRTPDVGTSTRGADWIAFRPPALDRFALDRATAWFEAAWRHAVAPDEVRTRPN